MIVKFDYSNFMAILKSMVLRGWLFHKIWILFTVNNLCYTSFNKCFIKLVYSSSNALPLFILADYLLLI